MCFTIKQPQSKEEFKHYYHLRWLLLRAPWNQPEGSEVDNIEDQCFHLIAVNENNKVIAVARLQFNSNAEAQIRYMAVAREHEKKGIGRELINAMEKYAQNSSCKKIVFACKRTRYCFLSKAWLQSNRKKLFIV